MGWMESVGKYSDVSCGWWKYAPVANVAEFDNVTNQCDEIESEMCFGNRITI